VEVLPGREIDVEVMKLIDGVVKKFLQKVVGKRRWTGLQLAIGTYHCVCNSLYCSCRFNIIIITYKPTIK